ncbi:MAG: tripartite tricarboxylate transporter permease [Candidatus Altiarchaeota archaeon]
MFLEILFFIFLGITLGIISGLLPGLHVNTIYLLIPLFSAFFIDLNISVYGLITFIISAAITSTIVDFIPSIFLGAPEEATALSVLPGHRLLLQGKGLEALFLTTSGGVFTTLLFFVLTPLLLFILPIIHSLLKFYIAFVLLVICFFMILTEKNKERIFFSVLVFLLSGSLGIITLNSGILPENFVLFPIFTGLFGIPTLLLSLKHKSNIPPQEEVIFNTERKLIFSGSIKAFFASILLGLLPGVGVAQATVLTQELTKKKDPREFLISVGGVNTAVALISILSLYTVKRARSGAAIAIRNLLENFTIYDILLLISVSLISVGISAILTLYIGNKILKFIQKFPYSKISLIILILLFFLCFIFTGLNGILILLVSTSIGIIAPLSKIKRSHSMGVLIIPVILFYLGINF